MMKLLSLLTLIATLALTGCDPSRSNTPPTSNAGADQTVNENTPVSLSGSGADAEDTVHYSWTQTSGTTVMLSGADTENASFTAPEVNADEDLVFQLTVTDDDGASTTDMVTVSVANVPNVPPMADAGPDQTVDETMPVSLSGSGVDAEGAVQYSWTQTSGTTVMLSDADTENASFTAPNVDADEDLVFQLTVTDDDGASATDTVTVTVLWSEVTYTITTIAGADSASGDGGPATAALLTFPYSVDVDEEGNLYIADSENHRIRRVDAESGIITTFAGTGEEGFGGDGGPATAAKLDWPSGVAVDAAGNVYIADQENERIRKVDAEGIITTFAGSGSYGYKGGEDGIPATEAKLNWPTGVAVGANGHVYIADSYNNLIREVDTEGIITTIAGTGRIFGFFEEPDEDDVGDGGPATEAKLDWPIGIAVDAEGNVYVADRGHHRVRKLTRMGAGYVITTIAGTGDEGDEDGDGDIGDGGAAVEAQLDGPRGVAVDEDGRVYVADTGANRIRQIDLEGMITTIAGGEDGGDEAPMMARLSVPRGLAVDADGVLYVADTGNNQIHRLDDEGMTAVAGVAGLGDGGPATHARLLDPNGVAIDADGTVYITDTGNRRVRKVDAEGVITTFAGTGEQGDGGDGGPATSAQFYYPGGIAIDSAGNVYITDLYGHRVRKVDTEGIITTFAGTGEAGDEDKDGDIGDGGPATSAQLHYPAGLAFDADDNLYIADAGNSRIRKVTRMGEDYVITTFAGSERSFSGDDGPAAEAQLSSPLGFEIDGDGNFYLTDLYYDRNRVRKIDTEGIITTLAETTSIGGVTVGADGSVFISEVGAGRILRLSPSGEFSIIAGSAKSGFSGDGGPATQAQLHKPKGIELDASGNVYVADSENNRVRRLTPDN